MSVERHADTSEMYMAHAMFRREFGLLPGLIRGVADGDTNRAGVIAEHFTLIHLVLFHHHRGEDTHLWPLLRTRAADAAPVMQVLEDQHKEMDSVLAEVAAGLASWSETASQGTGASIADAADRLRDLLTEHLTLEEEQALPLLEQHVTEAEWDEMVRSEAGTVEPSRITLLTGMMLYEASPQAVQKIMDNAPPAARAAIADGVAAEAFAQHSELVYGTPSPAKSSTLEVG
jgi:iron-sulfur cluster repair protein YtfE (RIC family)